jgi:hypothetical protein
MIFPRDRGQNFNVDYEDSDASFGNDVLSQNEALALPTIKKKKKLLPVMPQLNP